MTIEKEIEELIKDGLGRLRADLGAEMEAALAANDGDIVGAVAPAWPTWAVFDHGQQNTTAAIYRVQMFTTTRGGAMGARFYDMGEWEDCDGPQFLGFIEGAKFEEQAQGRADKLMVNKRLAAYDWLVYREGLEVMRVGSSLAGDADMAIYEYAVTTQGVELEGRLGAAEYAEANGITARRADAAPPPA